MAPGLRIGTPHSLHPYIDYPQLPTEVMLTEEDGLQSLTPLTALTAPNHQ